MIDSNLISDKGRGFAGIIENALKPLNSNQQFIDQFADKNAVILLNSFNLNHAALIILNEGKIQVKSVENKPRENLEKEKIGWDGFLEMDSATFLGLAMNRLSLLSIVKKVLKGEVKMKGLRKLIILLKVFKLLS